MNMRKIAYLSCLSCAAFFISNCDYTPPASTANEKESQLQETLSGEAIAQVGLPAITHFREKRILKQIYELRDQDGLLTYTYVFNNLSGKFIKLCDSEGYGIPYATEYTNPQSEQWYKLPYTHTGDYPWGHTTLPQADPNGLYSPASAEGTWVLCLDPDTKKAQPQYIEPPVLVTTYQLNN